MKKIVKIIIKCIFCFVGIGIIGMLINIQKKIIKKESTYKKRYEAYYKLTNQWLLNHLENKELYKYFEKNNIKKIAIYGAGTIGELFYNEIKNTGLKVSFFIDNNIDKEGTSLGDITIIGCDKIDIQESVDAIIVSPVLDYKEIEKMLQEKKLNATKIISLEQIVCEL